MKVLLAIQFLLFCKLYFYISCIAPSSGTWPKKYQLRLVFLCSDFSKNNIYLSANILDFKLQFFADRKMHASKPFDKEIFNK